MISPWELRAWGALEPANHFLFLRLLHAILSHERMGIRGGFHRLLMITISLYPVRRAPKEHFFHAGSCEEKKFFIARKNGEHAYFQGFYACLFFKMASRLKTAPETPLTSVLARLQSAFLKIIGDKPISLPVGQRVPSRPGFNGLAPVPFTYLLIGSVVARMSAQCAPPR